MSGILNTTGSVSGILGSSVLDPGAQSSAPLSHRNILINGGMTVWQRATAATIVTAAVATADRWRMEEASDGAYSSEKYDMSLADMTATGHRTALKLACTTADGTIGSSQYAYCNQNIEAQNLQHLQYGGANAKTITLSFWVKSNKTGIYSIILRKLDTTTYHYVKEYTISQADTWEYKTITITPTAGGTSLITGSGGVIDNNNGAGFQLGFNLAFGSNYNGATNDAWSSNGNHYATSNQVNWMDSTSNVFYITGVQLEPGSNATPFETRSYGQELLLCERYFQYLLAPGDASERNVGNAASYTTADCYCIVKFRPMRSISSGDYTATFYNGGVGWRAPGNNQYADFSSVTVNQITDRTLRCSWSGSGFVQGGAAWLATRHATSYASLECEV